jgi:hypothetical protein
VGRAYRQLIEKWRPVLEREAHCLALPVAG